MNKKIIGIVISMLMIATVIPIVGYPIQTEINSSDSGQPPFKAPGPGYAPNPPSDQVSDVPLIREHPQNAPVLQDDIVLNLLEQVDTSIYLGYLEDITSFGPRYTGSASCIAAAEYIYNQFQSMGLMVRYHHWTYGSYSSDNVEATLTGTDESSDDIYIICGHYDTVSSSPGADDDASGTVAVLTAAYLMSQSQYTFNHTIKFVAFSGEEEGLYGSRMYAQEASAQDWDIVGVLNCDMISYAITTTDGSNLVVYENTASHWLYTYTVSINTEYNDYIHLTLHSGGTSSGSDHYYFWQYGYSAIFYFEYKETPYYHTAQDTIAHINATYAVKNIRLILATLAELAEISSANPPPYPILSFNPISFNFGPVDQGATDSTSFTIWNSGTQILSYSLSESCDWMTVSPTSGDSTGEHHTITISITTVNLELGSYSYSIDISSNGGSGTFTVYVTVVELIEILDQSQTTYNHNYAFYSTRWCGQSFKPTTDSLTRVELFIRKAGVPSSDVVLSVRSSLTGVDLVSLSKPASQIPTNNGWVEFNFSDLSVTPGNTYYLVLRTISGTSTNCYYWSYGTGTSYTNGVLCYSPTGGSSWTQYSQYDFCFKVYGFSAPPTPALSYTPTSHDFGSVAAGATGSTTFEIWNIGTGILTYSLSESATWVIVSPTSGSSTSEHDTITVNIDTTGLSIGSYTCPISISSNGGSGTFTVAVTVIVPTPTLAYNPGSYNFGDMTAGSTSSTTFELWNSGTGTLTYSLSESISWITSISPTSGSSTNEHDTITVSIDTTGLSLGLYTDSVSISSNDGSGTFTVSVNIVTIAPTLSYTPTSYAFGDMTPGHTASTTFEIWNSGTGTLTYTLSESSSWVTVSPTSGSSTSEHDTITVNIDTTGLSVGSYNYPVSISSNGGSGTFIIYLNVIAPTEVLDQQQTVSSNNFALYSTRWGGQSFTPTLNSLNRVELYTRKTGSPPSALVLSLRSSISGPDLVSVSKPASQISTTNGWVEFDFSDLTVTPGSTYYLVVRTIGGTSTNCYYWGYGTGSPYANGVLWYSATGGSSWTQYATNDFTFKTYGFS
jgi:hypothetical protein